MVRVAIDKFGGFPDHVRQSALDKVEHADPRIVRWTADDDGVTVELQGAGDDAAVAERVRQLIQETIDSYRFFKSETLDESDGEPINAVSPFPQLVESGQVAMIGPGTPVYQGELARRLQAADDTFRDIAWARGGMEQLYPSTVLTESLATNGYLASYPQHAIFAASLHRDLDSLNEAAAMAKDEPAGDYPLTVRKFLGEAEEILSPTVCYRCFDSLRLSPGLARPLAAGRTFTGTAICHRREDKALEELARLQSFRMREVVFFGEPAFVAEHRDWWIDEFIRLLKSWKLRFRIVAASDAFFSATAAQKRTYQSMRRLKYECQVQLPHSGNWLAVASFNNHEATLTKAYELTGDGDSGVHSGCVGFGLDRLVFGVLSQFGTDSDKWPEPMRQFFKEGAAQEAGWSI